MTERRQIERNLLVFFPLRKKREKVTSKQVKEMDSNSNSLGFFAEPLNWSAGFSRLLLFWYQRGIWAWNSCVSEMRSSTFKSFFKASMPTHTSLLNYFWKFLVNSVLDIKSLLEGSFMTLGELLNRCLFEGSESQLGRRWLFLGFQSYETNQQSLPYALLMGNPCMENLWAILDPLLVQRGIPKAGSLFCCGHQLHSQ